MKCGDMFSWVRWVIANTHAPSLTTWHPVLLLHFVSRNNITRVGPKPGFGTIRPNKHHLVITYYVLTVVLLAHKSWTMTAGQRLGWLASLLEAVCPCLAHSRITGSSATSAIVGFFFCLFRASGFQVWLWDPGLVAVQLCPRSVEDC